MIAGVLIAFAALTGAPAAARAATSADYFGTNLQPLSAAKPSLWGSMFDQLSAGGMSIDRIEVRWKDTEPTAPSAGGTPRWGSTDGLIGLMATHGLRAAPIFRFAPDWAQTRNDELPPSSYDDFGTFVAAFAERYGPGGDFWAAGGAFARANPGVATQPVQSYEIWNEVNLAQYAWNHVPDPVAYTALLKVIRPILKAAQPSAIMLGDLAWQNSAADGAGVYANYATALGAAGGLTYLDGMGYHPYAPDADSIFTLVRRLRAELDGAGYPTMPIYANEAGLPADFDGPGIRFAHDIPAAQDTLQFPSDGARASSLAFAGEALADSDCGVEQFLPYAITGSETVLDPIHEGFMGMIRKDGTPTKTIGALQRASLRWRAKVDAGIPPRLSICRGGTSPEASLLTIPITITGTSSGCVEMNDAYDGNPMEGVLLRLVGADGTELATARSDAYGQAGACVPDPNLNFPFRAYADIPNAGVSGSVVCDVPGSGCPAGVALAPSVRSTLSARVATGSAPPASVSTPPPSAAQQRIATAKACGWKLDATITALQLRGGNGRSRATVRLLATCPTVPVGTSVRFVVSIKHKNRKTETRIRSVFLKTGKPTRIQVLTKLTKTDTIAVTHQVDPLTGVPRIREAVPVRTPKSKT